MNVSRIKMRLRWRSQSFFFSALLLAVTTSSATELTNLVMPESTLPVGVSYATIPEGQAPLGVTANPMASSSPEFIAGLLHISGPGLGPPDAFEEGMLAVYQRQGKPFYFSHALRAKSKQAATRFREKIDKDFNRAPEYVSFQVGNLVAWMFSKSDYKTVDFLTISDFIAVKLGVRPANNLPRGAASAAEIKAKAASAWAAADMRAAERLFLWEGSAAKVAHTIKRFVIPREVIPTETMKATLKPATANDVPAAAPGEEHMVPNVKITGHLTIEGQSLGSPYADGTVSHKYTMWIGQHSDGRFYFASFGPPQ